MIIKSKSSRTIVALVMGTGLLITVYAAFGYVTKERIIDTEKFKVKLVHKDKNWEWLLALRVKAIDSQSSWIFEINRELWKRLL